MFFTDNPINDKRTLIISLIQVIGLWFFEFNKDWYFLLILLIAINTIYYLLQRNPKLVRLPKYQHLTKLLLLAVQVLILNIFFSPQINLTFKTVSPIIQSFMKNNILLCNVLSTINPVKFNILLLGLLLASNEANILIRYVFTLIDIAPPEEKKDNLQINSEKELNAGRIIGILERIIIYFFVLNAQYAAIGFILVAKSFTRFKELDKKQFAEYVLVGTLLSSILAILTAVTIKHLLLLCQ